MNVQIRLVLSALALSALIWTYADQASHETHPLTAIPIEIVPPADPEAEYVVQATGPAARPKSAVVRVALTFRGPRSKIRELKQDERQNKLEGLQIKLTGEIVPGRSETLDLETAVRQLPELTARGLKIESVSPESVAYTVERYRKVKVTLTPVVTLLGSGLRGTPTFNPPVVTAIVSESELAPGATLPELAVSLDSAIEAELAKGGSEGRQELQFPITLQSSWPGVTPRAFVPSVVQVKAVVERQPRKVKKDRVPLSIGFPLAIKPWEYEWQVAEDDLLQSDVEFRVPQTREQEFEQIPPNNITARIAIEAADLPTAADTQGKRLTKTIRFIPPEGFEDAKVISPPKTVKLQIQKRP